MLLFNYKKIALRGVTVLTLFFVLLFTNAQIKVMSYNLLNFPTGNFIGRVDTLRPIIDFYKPQLFLIQELKTEDGLIEIADMMNDLGYGTFTNAPFIAQQSDPNNPYFLQQALVYDTDIFTLAFQDEIITSVRDVNYYKLYLNDETQQDGSDTTFINVFVTHLKSSTGTDNEQSRLQMVNAFESYIEANLDSDDLVMIAGDFNLYSTNEPAYQELVNASNEIPMIDPFANYGNWAVSNFNHREILTQSTRSSQIGNDGAGGGVDDRFDFIMFSNAFYSNSSPVKFLEGSFKSLGNNGTCYNSSITSCASGNDVPSNILRNLYYMSDHIPQVCELEIDLNLSVTENVPSNVDFTWEKGNVIQSNGGILINSDRPQDLDLIIYSMSGQAILEKSLDVTYSTYYFPFDTEQMSDGMYLIAIRTASNQVISKKFIVKK
jgi:exonuclease III